MEASTNLLTIPEDVVLIYSTILINLIYFKLPNIFTAIKCSIFATLRFIEYKEFDFSSYIFVS